MRETDTVQHREAAGAGPVEEVLRRVRELCVPALRAAVAELEAPARRAAEYHFGWVDEAGRRVEANGGKALRPALTLLCAEAAGGQADEAVPAAVAVELVHNFSLLHDDVIDGDRTRRHRATVWAVFGRPTAILAGDSLLSLAFEVLAESRPAGVGVLAEAVTRLNDGQLRDMDLETRVDVSLAECRDMAARKTGALMAAACRLGAESGGADGERAGRFADFGGALGLAFQAADDLLGIWGDAQVTGKPVGSDLVNRKRSLPVTAALAGRAPYAGRLREWYRDGGTGTTPDAVGRPPSSSETGRSDAPTAAEIAEVTGWVERAGGRRWAVAAARRELDAGLAALERAGPLEPAAGRLRALAHHLTFRNR
ncbi:polyprenyl synthetase family protein [Stackebrandtia nassauensis]|uniref:Polyprenyl synthetase n=1 Tax=Stackebrandtia nassauensis (strain DSM 44728 / CIP 108903 / NRRL B-16338 / NBRC 102104 / LLR-40K-21) TaxID=446470 RepID=D3PZL9_STANL|nr:polyprenyl synthetase family protein [Stackebrandtia nassauensis]ADD41693.1 Polyprenyl synthetase [Stackebrandtia nassauensis DSM 44728]